MCAPSKAVALAALLAGIAVTGAVQAQDSPSTTSIKNLQARDPKDAAAKDGKDVVVSTGAPAAAGAKTAGAVPKDPAVSATVPRQRRPVLRCWQEGRLVFEGAGVTPSAQGQAAIELRNATGTALQVFDLKNGLCLVDYGNE